MKSWDNLRWWSRLDLRGIPEPALPPKELRYKAFELTSFDEVKVVILGQDPYHTKGMAHGLAFSVPPSVKSLPPTLRNIFKEYSSDLHLPTPRNGDLTDWAKRGVLLLNTVLTVELGRPLSHKGKGWEKLTIEVIQKLSEYKQGLVFILWGNYAQQYRGLINEDKHLVVASVHPSPLSANRGFFGSRPFSKANAFLDQPVDWRL